MLVISRKIIFTYEKSHKFKILRIVDYFIKGIEKKLVPRALLSYINPWKFLRTLEKCENDSPTARASLSTSLVFLKIPACLYNLTMHSTRFLIL